eukprot:2959971-Pyramimonas_sp.AAC.1
MQPRHSQRREPGEMGVQGLQAIYCQNGLQNGLQYAHQELAEHDLPSHSSICQTSARDPYRWPVFSSRPPI